MVTNIIFTQMVTKFKINWEGHEDQPSIRTQLEKTCKIDNIPLTYAPNITYLGGILQQDDPHHTTQPNPHLKYTFFTPPPPQHIHHTTLPTQRTPKIHFLHPHHHHPPPPAPFSPLITLEFVSVTLLSYFH